MKKNLFFLFGLFLATNTLPLVAQTSEKLTGTIIGTAICVDGNTAENLFDNDFDTKAPLPKQMAEENVNCSRGFQYIRYVGPNDARCKLSELAFYGYKSNGNSSKLYQLTNLPVVTIHTVWSINMYKKRGDDPFYVGSVWDLDLGFGND